jgi:hypothetical protein
MDKIFTLILGVIAMLIPSLKKAGAYGIKELKEALIGANEVSLELAKQFKDGVQFSDFTAFYAKLTNDAAFKAKVQAAYEGYKQIPNEVKDIDAGEGLELAGVQIEYVPKFIEVFKTEQA